MTQQELLERMKLLSTAIQINGEVKQLVMGDGVMNVYNGCFEGKQHEEDKTSDADVQSKETTEVPEDKKLRCIHDAIETMQNEGLLKHKQQYAVIMAALELSPINMHFDSASAFIKMLEMAKVNDIPTVRTINYGIGIFADRYADIDDWQFTDADSSETTYRKNIGKRFRSLYTKAMREL
jgi:hypothetical protein